MTGAILMGLGFSPLARLGPLADRQHRAGGLRRAGHADHRARRAVTELDLQQLSAMVGRQLPFFSLIVPFWLVWAFAGLRGDARGVAGDPRGRACRSRCPQFLISNLHGPWLVDVVASVGLDGRGDAVPEGLAAPAALGPRRRAPTPRAQAAARRRAGSAAGVGALDRS